MMTRRNYIHLDDLMEICYRVVQSSKAGTFTCAHQKSVHISEMADAAFSAFGHQCRLKLLTDKPDLADLPIIDDYSLYSQIDYWPNIDIEEGFKRIRNYRENNS